MKRTVLIPAVGLLVVVGGFAGVTAAVSGTTSTTALDASSTATTVDGTPALAADIVGGRIASKYHPLPWVGSDVSDVTCPSPLTARVGARVTCTGRDGTSTVTIDVTTTQASASSITWKFDR